MELTAYDVVKAQFGIDCVADAHIFRELGWFYVRAIQEPGFVCPTCRVTFEVLRRRYLNKHGQRYLRWGLLCRACRRLRTPADLGDDFQRRLQPLSPLYSSGTKGVTSTILGSNSPALQRVVETAIKVAALKRELQVLEWELARAQDDLLSDTPDGKVTWKSPLGVTVITQPTTEARALAGVSVAKLKALGLERFVKQVPNVTALRFACERQEVDVQPLIQGNHFVVVRAATVTVHFPESTRRVLTGEELDALYRRFTGGERRSVLCADFELSQQQLTAAVRKAVRVRIDGSSTYGFSDCESEEEDEDWNVERDEDERDVDEEARERALQTRDWMSDAEEDARASESGWPYADYADCGEEPDEQRTARMEEDVEQSGVDAPDEEPPNLDD